MYWIINIVELYHQVFYFPPPPPLSENRDLEFNLYWVVNILFGSEKMYWIINEELS